MSTTLIKEVFNMARKSRQVETRMVSEYLLLNYSKFPSRTGVPLGTIDDKLSAEQGYQKAINMSRPYRPEADAIVFLPNYILLVEAKIWNVINGLAKLPMYRDLVPFTPELAPYTGTEILMELVVGWTNDNLEIMARGLGVTIKVYSPPWLADVVRGMHNYWTKDYQAERQRILETRQNLGLE
jgi:hypothetical protein